MQTKSYADAADADGIHTKTNMSPTPSEGGHNGALYFTALLYHIFIRINVFILMLVSGRLQLLINSTCFGWCPVTSINKSHVLTACARKNCYINTWLSFH